jgi:lipopolysaccharide export system protein LptC
MHRTWRAYLPLTLVVGVAAVSLWLKDVSLLGVVLDQRGFRHEPGMIIEGLRLAEIDRKSGAAQVLTADRMTHFLDDDTLHLLEPRYDRVQAGAPRLHIESRRGLVSEDRDNFYFLGAVRLQRDEAGAFGLPLLLTTEYLRVMLSADQVRTDKPVSVKQGKSRIDAGGMEADGKARAMVFTAPVRSVYEN